MAPGRQWRSSPAVLLSASRPSRWQQPHLLPNQQRQQCRHREWVLDRHPSGRRPSSWSGAAEEWAGPLPPLCRPMPAQAPVRHRPCLVLAQYQLTCRRMGRPPCATASSAWARYLQSDPVGSPPLRLSECQKPAAVGRRDPSAGHVRTCSPMVDRPTWLPGGSAAWERPPRRFACFQLCCPVWARCRASGHVSRRAPGCPVGTAQELCPYGRQVCRQKSPSRAPRFPAATMAAWGRRPCDLRGSSL
jgi:hypothetical protein